MPTPRRYAQLDVCHRCESHVILALDAPVMALTVRLDPVPLDAHAELSARLDGRWTYDLIDTGRRRELAYRDEHRILDRDHPVLATHRCPGPIPATTPIHEPPEPPEQVHPPF